MEIMKTVLKEVAFYLFKIKNLDVYMAVWYL